VVKAFVSNWTDALPLHLEPPLLITEPR